MLRQCAQVRVWDRVATVSMLYVPKAAQCLLHTALQTLITCTEHFESSLRRGTQALCTDVSSIVLVCLHKPSVLAVT